MAVTVTFSAAGHGTSFTLSSADPAVRLTDATWCVKSAGDPMLGSGLSAASACYRSDTGRGDLLLTRRIKPSRAVPPS